MVGVAAANPAARSTARRRLAVVGGGWAGLTAAVEACERGDQVSLFEMAPGWGGRARTLDTAAGALDNGQHILVGAYTQTLTVMRRVGVDPETVLLRRPLALTTPDGSGLVLPPGPAPLAFARGVLGHPRWRRRERLALLAAAVRWRLAGFRCDPGLDVARLCAGLPEAVRSELIEPLCVAALNTPAAEASAQVFLNVLRDALFAGPGAADLLLPRAPLGDLLPQAAVRWLVTRGARVAATRRVGVIEPGAGGGWQVDGEPFDAVVLAASARESARLARPFAPGWARLAEALDYQPIVTVWLRSPGLRLTQPMHALPASDTAPAQFVFDLGQLWGDAGAPGPGEPDRPAVPSTDGLLAFVISGAGPWVARGLDATVEAVREQALRELDGRLRAPLERVHAAVEKRATFACTPGLARPPTAVAPGLVAAGDFIDGPYPATLEGSVRAALAAIDQLNVACGRDLRVFSGQNAEQ